MSTNTARTAASPAAVLVQDKQAEARAMASGVPAAWRGCPLRAYLPGHHCGRRPVAAKLAVVARAACRLPIARILAGDADTAYAARSAGHACSGTPLEACRPSCAARGPRSGTERYASHRLTARPPQRETPVAVLVSVLQGSVGVWCERGAYAWLTTAHPPAEAPTSSRRWKSASGRGQPPVRPPEKLAADGTMSLDCTQQLRVPDSRSMRAYSPHTPLSLHYPVIRTRELPTESHGRAPRAMSGTRTATAAEPARKEL